MRSVLREVAPGIRPQLISAVTLRLLWASGSFTYWGRRDQLQKFSWVWRTPTARACSDNQGSQNPKAQEMGTQLSFSIQWPTERSVPTAFPPLREEQEDGP